MMQNEFPGAYLDINSLRYLVVDDSATIRKMMVQFLSSLGIQSIAEANTGLEAWNMCVKAAQKNAAYQIILCDWHMPDMEGPEFIAQCHGLPAYKGAGFIMLTSEADATNVVNAMMAGADDYALKPVSKELLKSKITAVASKKFG